MPASHPTPYDDVNAALDELLAGIRAALRDDFVGMYLYGSLATGDFNAESSDVDVLVVTHDALRPEQIAALAALHARFAVGDSPWAVEIEASYISLDALPRFDPTSTLFPRIDRGSGELRLQSHDVDWVIQRYVLHECGMTLAGPPLATLIEPVTADYLRRATVELMRVWWGPMADDASRLQGRGYQAYAVLTMCRALYTLRHGTIVSKPQAARWALTNVDENVGGRFGALIERALAWRKEQQDVLGDDVRETQELIRYTLRQCEELQAPLERTGFH